MLSFPTEHIHFVNQYLKPRSHFRRWLKRTLPAVDRLLPRPRTLTSRTPFIRDNPRFYPFLEEILEKGIFSPENYLEQNPDVRAEGVDPFFHFLSFGWKEGRMGGWDWSRAARLLSAHSPLRKMHLCCIENPPPRRYQKGAAPINLHGWFVSGDGLPAEQIVIQIGRRRIIAGRPVETEENSPDKVSAQVIPAKYRFSAHFCLGDGFKWLRVYAYTRQGKKTIGRYLIQSLPAPANQPDILNHGQSENLLEKNRKDFRQIQQKAWLDFLASPQKLVFPSVTNPPKISVLIPVWNQPELTFACLQTLIRNAGIGNYEVLLLDNGSDQPIKTLFSRCQGARLLVNSQNEGFVRGMNQLAEAAHGDFLLFLNSDALIRPHALKRATQAFAEDPDLGAVGAKLILPHGYLQEAGSILWNDGTASGYGRNWNPDCDEVSHPRYVDFCSGAFLLTPQSLFLHSGGFNERFSPAYYEEVDYCVRLWKSGKKVLYHPDVEVDHFEFGSSPKSEAAIGLQRRNRLIFEQLHRDWLQHQFTYHENNFQPASIHRQNGTYRGWILFIDDAMPSAARGSGCPRLIQILNELTQQGWKITVFPLRFPQFDPSQVRRELSPHIELIRPVDATSLRPFLERRGSSFDQMWISRPHNMEYFLQLKKAHPNLLSPSVRIIYDAEAIYARREEIRGQLLGDASEPSSKSLSLSEELALGSQADAIVAVSDGEKQLFEEGFPAPHPPIFVLPYSPDQRILTKTSFAERNGLLFVGRLVEHNSPNVDSMIWFLSEVFPLLQKESKDIPVSICGDCQNERLLAMASSLVSVEGRQASLDPFYSRSRVFVAPTRFAAGIPLKLLDAAQAGIPIVCTSLLAGQLGWENEQEVLVADDPAGFAQQVLRLYHDADLWVKLRENALQRMTTDYCPRIFASRLESVFNSHPPESSIGQVQPGMSFLHSRTQESLSF